MCANRSTARGKSLRAKKNRIKTCEQCGSEFSFAPGEKRQRFCSRSCAASHNNSGVARNAAGGTRPSAPKVHCQRCGAEKPDKRTKMPYCSNTCRQEHEVDRWLAGELDGNRKYDCCEYVRRGAERIQGRTCRSCDIVSVRPEVSLVLQLNHIDGNWRNNSPDNVELLCPTCHALTDNFGAKNMGNGRTWKREYSQFSPKS